MVWLINIGSMYLSTMCIVYNILLKHFFQDKKLNTINNNNKKKTLYF